MHTNHEPRRCRFALPLAALVTAGAIAILSWLPDEAGIAPSRPAVAPAAPAAAATAQAIGSERVDTVAVASGWYGAPAGTTMTFSLEDENVFRFAGKDTTQPQPAQTRAEATVVLQVLDRRDDAIAVLATVSSLRFLDAQGRHFAGDQVAEHFVAAVREPVVVRLLPDGTLDALRFADRLDGEQRNFLRGILSVLVFPCPTDDAASWTTHGVDATGVFVARCERLPAAPGQRILRRSKVRYETISGMEALPEHELTGGAKATFGDATAWLAAVALEERLLCKMPLLDLQIDHRRRARVELVGVERQAVPAGAAAVWDGDWATPFGGGEPMQDRLGEAEQRHWQRELGGVTLASLLADLRAVLAADPVDRAALDGAFLRLQWLVKLDPKAVAAIADQVADGSLQGSAANVALAALGAAGGPEAQRALLAVRADAGRSAEIRDAAAMAMLQLAQPLPELVQSLATAAAGDGLDAQCALLTLGALAPRGARLPDGSDPVAALLAMERNASGGERIAAWLRSVGNSGAPEAVGVAARYLDNPDTDVRAAACDSVRRVQSPAATQLLVERGLRDADPGVRQTAIRALAQRAGAGAALRGAATGDPDADVRAAAISALAEGPMDAADRAALEQIAASDAEPRVRSLADRLLRGE